MFESRSAEDLTREAERLERQVAELDSQIASINPYEVYVKALDRQANPEFQAKHAELFKRLEGYECSFELSNLTAAVENVILETKKKVSKLIHTDNIVDANTLLFSISDPLHETFSLLLDHLVAANTKVE